jgi:hypothetical protein
MTTLPRALAVLGFAALAAGPSAAEEAFPVTPAGKGPQRLDATPALLAASAQGDLADLRLRDAAGGEVPFLLVPPPETPPAWAAAVRIRPVPPTKAESGAELDLGGVKEVAGLAVTFGQSGFLKRVRVEGSGDGQRWATLVEGEALYALPLDPGACGGEACPGALVRLELHFPATRARFLRLVLDDRRSPRVPPPTAARALLAGAGAPVPGPSLPLALSSREGEPGTSRFALRLPGPHLPVQALVLEVDAARLARRARVVESRLTGGRLTPIELGGAMLVAVERDGVLAGELRIPMRAPEEQELELVVEDGDNPPLPLRGVRAELAPVPWIFFESKDGQPLTARVGDPARQLPRYDLEALRPELPKLALARATAGEPARQVAAEPAAAAAAPGEAGAPGAAVDAKAYRWSRAVPAGEKGLSALALDADVLSRSPALSDLRLVEEGGRQLPYLLEQRDQPLVLPLAEQLQARDLPRQLQQAGVTLHALPSPQPSLPESRLVLTTQARVFTRTVKVWVEPDRPGAQGPELLSGQAWAHADPARPAPALTIPLPPYRAGRLLVAVDDGDNAPLALEAARLQLTSYRLRFFHPGGPLKLLYGAAEGVPAPRYDLALLAPRLRAAGARELALGPPPPPDASASNPQGTSRLVFWGVLGLAVVGLLALVTRLLLKAGPPAEGGGQGGGGDAPGA